MAYSGVPPNTPTEFMFQFFINLERKGLIQRSECCDMLGAVTASDSHDDSSNATTVDDRTLKPKRSVSPDQRERLLRDIRSRPKLRPVRGGRLVVESPRSRLNSEDGAEPPRPPKRVIKPDFDLFLNSSFEEASDDEGQYKIFPMTSASVVDLSPRSPSWHKTDDVSRRSKRSGRHTKLQRRHSIVVCETGLDRKQRDQNPVEFLSLTLEEVAHIRTVLTKAELESLATEPELYRQVSKAKLCFTCRATRFTLFGEWGTKCTFCKRTVCSKCISKMNVPVDHFKNIPVYTLNQSNMTQEIQEFVQKNIRTALPPSVPQTRVPSPTRRQLANSQQPWTDENTPEPEESWVEKRLSESRAIFSRLELSHRVQGPDNQQSPQLIKGPLMVICCGCKGMVTEIVRASRAASAMFSYGNSTLTTPNFNLWHLSTIARK